MSRSRDGKTLRPARAWFGLLRADQPALVPAALALLLVLLLSVAASGWWAMRTVDDSLAQARVDEVRAAADVLARATEVMLATGDVTALRRLVMDTAAHHHLTTCRISLPNGQILADADPSRITATTIPTTWGASDKADAPIVDVMPQHISIRYPLSVASAGGAVLELAAGPRPIDARWEVQSGMIAIAGLATVVVLLLYRQMRSQVRPLLAISQSLHASDAGETTTAALTVSPGLGRMAQAWNQLLEQTQDKRDQRIEQDVRASLASRQSAGGDLTDACNALSQGMAVVDEEQRIIYANGAAAVFLGQKRETLVGTDFATLKIDPGITEAVRDAITGPNRRRQTLEIQRNPGLGGDGVLRFAIRPIHRDDSRAAVIVIDDITQQRVAEQSRNTFIAQATHELRMPLTNIRLYVESALEDGDDDAKLRAQCLNVINSESRRLERLVSDMLSIAEIEAGSISLQHGDVRLDALFEELEGDFRAAAKDKQVDMAFSLPPKLPVIQADRERLFVALQNLVGNAIKYTPSQGRVEVIVEANANQLSVDVKDTGIGISEEDLPNVFEKFYRAGDRRVREITGSGLGLALSREVVRLHGGEITVQSMIDRGSTFSLTLPITVEAV